MALDHSVETNVMLPFSLEGLVVDLNRILNDYGSMLNDLVAQVLVDHIYLNVKGNLVNGIIGMASTVGAKTVAGEEVVITSGVMPSPAGSINLVWAKAANLTTNGQGAFLRKGTTIAGTALSFAGANNVAQSGMCFSIDFSPAVNQQYVLTYGGLLGDGIGNHNMIVLGVSSALVFP
jgi:hypothetical protein